MSSEIRADRVAASVLALAVILLPAESAAIPISATVVNGVVNIQSAAGVMNITTSPSAIINWGGFSVAVNELTRFVQNSPASAVLNRVVGANPSILSGAIETNGYLHLTNSGGIALSAGSVLQIGGGSLGSLALSNADFLSGALNFAGASGAGNLINAGAISVAAGGDLVLAAPQITNTGSIVAAAGGSITVHGNLVNDGLIRADGGTITVFAESMLGSGTFIADNMFVVTSSSGSTHGPALAVLSDASTIAIELSGLTPGADYNPIAAGSLLLGGGSLALTTGGGFVPQIGDTFRILDVQALVGSFRQISITGSIAANGVWDTSHLYVDGTITLLAASVPEPGTLALVLAGLGIAGPFALGRRRALRRLEARRTACLLGSDTSASGRVCY